VDQRPFDLDAAVVPGAAPVVTPRSIGLDAAVVLIAAAGAAGQTFRFEQDNPKKSSSQSYARYEVYKKKTTFSGLEGLRTLTLPGTKQEVFHGNALTKHGDFANDVAKGFVTFVAATVSPGGFPATAGVDASVADVAKGWVTFDANHVQRPGRPGDASVANHVQRPGQTGDADQRPGQTGDAIQRPGQPGVAHHVQRPRRPGVVDHVQRPGQTGDAIRINMLCESVLVL